MRTVSHSPALKCTASASYSLKLSVHVCKLRKMLVVKVQFSSGK